MRSILKSLFNLFFNNFGYKLLAVFLSIIVWAIIQGEQVQEVNRLLKQFEQTQKMMKQFSGGGMAKMMRGMKGMLPGMR